MRRTGTFKTKINKKVLTLCGVVVVLVAAVVVNQTVIKNRAADEGTTAVQANGENASEVSSSGVVQQMSFFESFRSERDTTRSQEIAYIDSIIEQGADAETMADAQQQKLSIVDNMEKEMTIESLLKAKGFNDAAVTLHTGSVNVILSAEMLTDEQVAQVLDIIVRETGEKTENVKITTAQ